MVVASAEIELHIPASRSLKSKRQILRSLKDRLRSRFNVSVAEVEHQDLWQRASLGVAVAAESEGFAREVIDAAIRLVESEPAVAVLDIRVEMY
jgi:uncharacterized protein